MSDNQSSILFAREVDRLALFTAIVGGLTVLLTYMLFFVGEEGGYFKSRFWLNIPVSTTRALCYGLQIPAGIGYLVFLAYATGSVGTGAATKGILQYWDRKGLAMAIALFSLASVMWPIFTKLHFDEGWGAGWPVASLITAAAAAIIMTAGAFEGDLQWPAILGVLVFSSVVVMADGVGWNAKLLHR